MPVEVLVSSSGNIFSFSSVVGVLEILQKKRQKMKNATVRE